MIKSPNKIRLMWVSGHTRIKRNETAEEVAGDALRKPLLLFHIQRNKDLKLQLVKHMYATKCNDWETL